MKFNEDFRRHMLLQLLYCKLKANAAILPFVTDNGFAMEIISKIYPFGAEYPEILSSYITQIKEAIKLNKHHDYRRSLFINYLRLVYNINPTEIDIEEKIRVANVRGNIDALYRFIIFEFKSNMGAERTAAETEITKYFMSREKPQEYIAILTDGLSFEIYQYETGRINRISKFILDEKEPLASFRAIDDLVYSTQKIMPTASEITTRFGPYSAVFNKSRLILEELFAKISSEISVLTKFNEWNSLLARVYGEKIGDERLFLRHTYLTVFSRLLITNAIYPNIVKTKSVYKGLLTGSFFSKNNLPNVAEPDFFSWALGTNVEEQFLALLAKIDRYLISFNLDNISEDILKEIYQELVDPVSRHSLGEYYTPDWIADIALKSLKYERGMVLDPACGSGTFLLATIRRLRKNGLKGADLVRASFNSIVGIDVHPLAVIMTKANILLALAKELKSADEEIYLPVYMSDTLQTYEDKKTVSIAVRVSSDEEFRIPIQTMKKGFNVDVLIDGLSSACKQAIKSEKSASSAWTGFKRNHLKDFSPNEEFLWKQNFNLFLTLIRANRDTIWSFILKNAYRPFYIRENKVDYIVGNPPWLAYRYIKDKDYKKKVKDLVLQNDLLDRKDVKLFTQLDTSTLFFVYSIKYFLKDGGKIAFVLPKTTILPSKQHFNFQRLGFNEIHDFSEVKPLFNVRSVLLLKWDTGKNKDIPIIYYKGLLPGKNLGLDAALHYLDTKLGKHSFIKSLPKPSHYYDLFQQGATIVPRCFWFIQKDKDAAQHKDVPYVETSDEALKEAKDNWRMKLEGRIEKNLIYSTVLSKDIIPFGIIEYEQIFIPLIKQKRSAYLANSDVLLERGFQYAAEWLSEIEKLWEANRQSNDRNLIEWLNYNQKLTKQNVNAAYIIVYNASGTNLAAALISRKGIINAEFKSNGFIADAKTYYYYPEHINEGKYLEAILNSRVVNFAIKKFQTQGLYGERDIHRRPFEICMIPKYDASNKLHKQLVDIGTKCENEIQKLIPLLAGNIGRIRSEVRRVIKGDLAKLNKIVENILLEAGQNSSVMPSHKKNVKNGDLFKD